MREGYQVMLISDAGTVIRMAVDGIKRSGRATQGVIVTRLRDGEHVSTLAPVVASDDDDAELVKTTSDADAGGQAAIDDGADPPPDDDDAPDDDAPDLDDADDL